MTKLFWINGQIVDETHAFLSCQDLGLTRGYGVFDFLRTYGKVPFYLKEHLERFFFSASQIDLVPPYRFDEILSAIDNLITAHPQENLGIKLFLTGGESLDGFIVSSSPSFWIMAFPLNVNTSQVIKLKTIEATRELARIKSLNYLQSSLWAKRYKAQGYDDIIYKNPDGFLTESSTSNLFFIKGGKLITASQEILMGITRQVVLEVAGTVLPVSLRLLHESELKDVEACFATSTTKELCPITLIDSFNYGTNHHPMFNLLQKAFIEHRENYVKTLLTQKN